MAQLTELEQSFLAVIDLCFQLEAVNIRPRLSRRLATAWGRSVEKAFAIGWLKNEEVDPAAANPSVLRAAERGARDFVP